MVLKGSEMFSRVISIFTACSWSKRAYTVAELVGYRTVYAMSHELSHLLNLVISASATFSYRCTGLSDETPPNNKSLSESRSPD